MSRRKEGERRTLEVARFSPDWLPEKKLKGGREESRDE